MALPSFTPPQRKALLIVGAAAVSAVLAFFPEARSALTGLADLLAEVLR